MPGLPVQIVVAMATMANQMTLDKFLIMPYLLKYWHYHQVKYAYLF